MSLPKTPGVMCKDLCRFSPRMGGWRYIRRKQIKEERLRWVLPIVKGGTRLVDVAVVCTHSNKGSGKMGSGIQKGWRESFGTQSDYT